MDKNSFLKEHFGVSEEILEIAEKAEKRAAEQFKRIDDMAQLNSIKVMKAFADNRVSSEYFIPS